METLADSKQFPEDWIMKYRWDKGKKDANVLPSGEKIVHVKVGGRTSAIVPSLQKKTGAVAADVDSEDLDDEVEKPAKGKKRKSKDVEAEQDEKPAKKGRVQKSTQANGVKHEDEPQVNGDAEEEDEKPSKRAGTKRGTPKKTEKPATPGSRKSARTRS